MKFFTQVQESVRKDVERAFGVLQARFHVLCTPSKLWYLQDIHYIVKACVLLHNMIIEAKGFAISTSEYTPRTALLLTSKDMSWLITGLSRLKNVVAHDKLRSDLIEELWTWKGNQ